MTARASARTKESNRGGAQRSAGEVADSMGARPAVSRGEGLDRKHNVIENVRMGAHNYPMGPGV